MEQARGKEGTRSAGVSFARTACPGLRGAAGEAQPRLLLLRDVGRSWQIVACRCLSCSRPCPPDLPPWHAAAALTARGRWGAARLGQCETPARPRHPSTPKAPLYSYPCLAGGSATPSSWALQSPEWSVRCFGLS